MSAKEKKPLQILFLTSRLPYPPDRGDKVRTNFLLHKFAEAGEVTLVTLVDKNKDQDSIYALKKIIEKCYFIHQSLFMSLSRLMAAMFSDIPFQVAFYQNNAAKKQINDLLKRTHYDLVYVHLIRMAPYAMDIKDAKVILDFTDCISMEYKRSLSFRKGFSRLFFSIEAERTARYERYLAGRFDESWVISPIDKAAIIPNNKIAIIPNLVKIPDYTHDYTIKNRLVFVGNMSVPHNIHAALHIVRDIMPSLLECYPNLQLDIIGAGVTDVIKAIDGVSHSKVRGFVPDLYDALSECDVFIAPMYFCAGIQNKILEAMACGLPVITTSNAAASLGAKDGEHLLVAANDPEFVSKAITLINDDELRARIGKRGKELVVEKFSTISVSETINQRFSALIYK